MFSANENIMLRKHKRRVVEYIESTISENALEVGTSVMVMQVSCRQPGCVPLETAITIVFPKPPTKMKRRNRKEADAQEKQKQKDNDNVVVPAFPKPLVGDLEESRIGGSFKTRILMPLSDVTKEDVLDALPPDFEGGRRTTESMCLKARDMTFAQIGQLVGNDDTTDSKEGRRLVAEYLKACLEEYVERGCEAPEWGEPFAALGGEEKKEDMPVVVEAQTKNGTKGEVDPVDGVGNLTMDDKWGKGGNVVFRRPNEEDEDDVAEKIVLNPKKRPIVKYAPITSFASANKNAPYISSSEKLLQQMSKSEHAPGVRRPGCPCCDPDSASNYVDQMIGL